MADLTPIETLRAAATLIRETAAAPDCEGAWKRDHEDVNDITHDELVAACEGQGIAAWIALMSPDKAEHLAAWLEREAEHAKNSIVRDAPECPSCGEGCGGHDEQDFHDGTEDRGGCDRPLNGPDGHRCACFDEPLALARSILGRQS